MLMSPTNEIVECYEAIALASGKMAHAARSGDWARFEHLEHDCTRMIDELRRKSAGIRLDADQQRARLRALRMVLAADAQIRIVTEPDLHRVGAYLGLTPSGPAGA